jgi:hypothetical protein
MKPMDFSLGKSVGGNASGIAARRRSQAERDAVSWEVMDRDWYKASATAVRASASPAQSSVGSDAP